MYTGEIFCSHAGSNSCGGSSTTGRQKETGSSKTEGSKHQTQGREGKCFLTVEEIMSIILNVLFQFSFSHLSHCSVIPFQLAQDQEKLQELLALQDAADEDDEAFSVSFSIQCNMMSRKELF